MSKRPYEAELRHAIRRFWSTRQSQSKKQTSGPTADQGGRSAVTGGKQMDGFVSLVRGILLREGVPESCISTDKRIELPGWFRAEKKWDLLVVRGRELLAAIEFKSHIGPSFGNNFNNRTEEALGSATDIWAAFREGAFRPSSRPFLGYMMLLEDSSKSKSPVKVVEPHFGVFPEFQKASYRDRYMILIEKLLRERLYDGACLLTSRADGDGEYSEPHVELTFTRLIEPMLGRVASICR